MKKFTSTGFLAVGTLRLKQVYVRRAARAVPSLMNGVVQLKLLIGEEK
jgi:hypothetical protein